MISESMHTITTADAVSRLIDESQVLETKEWVSWHWPSIWTLVDLYFGKREAIWEVVGPIKETVTNARKTSDVIASGGGSNAGGGGGVYFDYHGTFNKKHLKWAQRIGGFFRCDLVCANEYTPATSSDS